MFPRKNLIAICALTALSLGGLVGCSSAAGGKSSATPTASVQLVDVPSTNEEVTGTKALTGKSGDKETPTWTTDYLLFGSHDKFNQEIAGQAQGLADSAGTQDYSDLKLSATIPIANGKFIAERLALKATLNKQDTASASKDSSSSETTKTSDGETAKSSAASDGATASTQSSSTSSEQASETASQSATPTTFEDSRTTYTLADQDQVIASSALFKDDQLQSLTRKVAGVLAKAGKLDLELVKKRAEDGNDTAQPDTSSAEKAAETIGADTALFDDAIVTSDGAIVLVLPQGEITAAAEGQLAVRLDATELQSAVSDQGKQALEAAKSGTKFAGFATAAEQGNFEPIKIAAPVDCEKEKCVALTYDDGPGKRTTDLLDTLKAEGVHATFFVVGPNAKAHPEILQREIKEGHAIGCHTWHHPQLSKLSPDKIDDEINSTVQAIQDAVPGYKVTYTRPPYGDGAFGKGNPTVIGELKKLGQAIIIWDVDTLDWKHKDSAKVVENIKKETHSGSIILMHDVHDASIDAAKDYITYLKEQGYKFVTIPQLMGDKLQPGARIFSLNNVK